MALRNSAFEVAVVERVIFDLNGEAFVMRIDRWTLGDGPRLQYAVEFEAEIIVKARGGVFLDYEAAEFRWRDGILAAGFGGFAEIALGLIGEKCYSLPRDWPVSRYISTRADGAPS